MVDRPDWSNGELVPTEARTIDDIRPGEIVSGSKLSRLSQADGSAPAGLPADVIMEMKREPDGYEATLATMQSTAEASIDEYIAEAGIDRDMFVAAFDKLPVEVQTAVYRDLMRYPTSTLVNRINRIKRKLTLDGMVAAKKFARELERG